MKKLIISCFILLLALVSCSPKQGNKNNTTIQNNINIENEISLSEPEIPFQEEVMYVNVHEGLQVKRFPSMDSENIISLDYLNKVLVIRKNNNVININGIKGKMVFISSAYPSVQGWVFNQHLSKIDSFIDKQFNIDKLSILGVWEELSGYPPVYAFTDEGYAEGGGSSYTGGNWEKKENTLTLTQNHAIAGGEEFSVTQLNEKIGIYKISTVNENIIILELLSDKSAMSNAHFFYDNILILKMEGTITKNHYLSWVNGEYYKRKLLLLKNQ